MDKIEQKTINIFNKLCKRCPDADVDSLKQISIYLAKTTGDNFKFKIKKNDYICIIVLKDGRKIKFWRCPGMFWFEVVRRDDDKGLLMTSYVYNFDENDLSKIRLYSDIITNDGMFISTFRPNNIYDESLKFGKISYYTNEEIDWVDELTGRDVCEDFDLVAKVCGIYPFNEDSFYKVERDEMPFDQFNGYIYSSLRRSDLLYDNVRILSKENNLIKKRTK